MFLFLEDIIMHKLIHHQQKLVLLRLLPIMVIILSRIILLPVVAGISYEIIRYAGRSENKFVKFATLPGLWLQNLTTNEPDDEQVEVAIRALEEVSVVD